MADPYSQFSSPDYMASQMANKLVNDYNNNPHAFSEEQGQSVAYLAARYGLNFHPESKGLKKFFFNLTNTATFGALGGLGVEAPREVGEEYGFGSATGKVGEFLGSAGGFIVPGAAGLKLGQAGLRGAAKLAPGLAKKAATSPRTQSAIRGAATGGAAFGLSDMLGDPSSIPENIAYGAAGGAVLGAVAPSLFKYTRPESIEGGGQFGNMQARAIESLRNAAKKGGARAQTMYQTNVQPGVQGAYGAAKGAAKNMYNRTPEDIRNAIENLRKQAASGGRDAFNSIKSGIDNSRFYKGNPVTGGLDYYGINFGNLGL